MVNSETIKGTVAKKSKGLKFKLGGNYLLWYLYHLLFADPSSIMRIVREPLFFDNLENEMHLVIDVGSGGGSYLKKLSKKSTSTVSMDLNLASQVRLARRLRKLKTNHFICSEGSQLPIKDSSCDTLVAMEVLEHIEKDEDAVKEAHRVLKTRGNIVVTVPLASCYGEQNKDHKYGHKRPGYHPEQIEKLLCKSGFKLIYKEFFFYEIAQLLFKFISRFRDFFRIFPPSMVVLPVFLEKIFINFFRKYSKPANIMIIAKKI